jgi:hypothetical protein
MASRFFEFKFTADGPKVLEEQTPLGTLGRNARGDFWWNPRQPNS